MKINIAELLITGSLTHNKVDIESSGATAILGNQDSTIEDCISRISTLCNNNLEGASNVEKGAAEDPNRPWMWKVMTLNASHPVETLPAIAES